MCFKDIFIFFSAIEGTVFSTVLFIGKRIPCGSVFLFLFFCGEMRDKALIFIIYGGPKQQFNYSAYCQIEGLCV